jgi:hypothetical protein
MGNTAKTGDITNIIKVESPALAAVCTFIAYEAYFSYQKLKEKYNCVRDNNPKDNNEMEAFIGSNRENIIKKINDTGAQPLSSFVKAINNDNKIKEKFDAISINEESNTRFWLELCVFGQNKLFNKIQQFFFKTSVSQYLGESIFKIRHGLTKEVATPLFKIAGTILGFSFIYYPPLTYLIITTLFNAGALLKALRKNIITSGGIKINDKYLDGLLGYLLHTIKEKNASTAAIRR